MTDLVPHNPTSVALLPAPILPRVIASALVDSQFSVPPRWHQGEALQTARRQGYADKLAVWAKELEASLAPASPQWLMQRVRNLGMAFGHEKDPDRATIWIHETARLLSDLPAEVVNDAIDQAVMQSERGFLPSVGEIRKLAEPLFETRKVQARRMAVLAKDHTLTALATIAPPDNRPPTAEQVDEIMAETRIPSYKPKSIDPRVLHNPTVADYIALGLSEEQAREAVKTLLPAPKPRGDTAKPTGDIATPQAQAAAE